MAKIWTKENTLELLRENPIANIAINGENYPISSMVLFYVDDGFNFYFGTGKESYKAKALLKSAKMSFGVWKQEVALVQGSGNAEEVADADEVARRMDDIVSETKHLPNFWPPLLGIWKDDYVLFKVKISILRVLDLSDAHLKESAPKFTEFRF